jgi:hypothetical protein
MVDTVPLLVKSKADLIAFFRGAGVGESILEPLRGRLQLDRSALSKYEIARRVLHAVNDLTDDRGLSIRREIVRRVAQFSAFENCYENSVLSARGGVQLVREFVNVHDAASRIDAHAERERSLHRSKINAELKAKADAKAERQRVRQEIAQLFGTSEPQRRGKALEAVLAKLFKFDNVLVREAISIRSTSGNGIVEQIDGVIEIDHQSYLVEMKWWSSNLGVPEVSEHMMRVFARAQSRGIIIAHPGYSAPAIEKVREFLRDAPFILCDLEEVVAIIDDDVSVQDWLRPKIHAAIIERDPFRKFRRGL